MISSNGPVCLPVRRTEQVLNANLGKVGDEKHLGWLTTSEKLLRIENTAHYLKIAYACCKGEDLSPHVLKVSLSCQKVFRELTLSIEVCMYRCIRALNLHSQAEEKVLIGHG